MLSRRGFLGALTALLAVPRSLCAHKPLTTFSGFWNPIELNLEALFEAERRRFIDGTGDPIGIPTGLTGSQPLPETEPRHEHRS